AGGGFPRSNRGAGDASAPSRPAARPASRPPSCSSGLDLCPPVGVLDLLFPDVLLERELRERFGGRIDQGVVQDFLADEGLGRLVGTSVVDEVREGGADFGL